MKLINILLILCSFVLVSCDTIEQCEFKALKMGIDIDLCGISQNRQSIQSKFYDYSNKQIELGTSSEQKSLQDNIRAAHITDLERSLYNCERNLFDCRLEASSTSCPAPPQKKCNCEEQIEGWRQ